MEGEGRQAGGKVLRSEWERCRLWWEDGAGVGREQVIERKGGVAVK